MADRAKWVSVPELGIAENKIACIETIEFNLFYVSSGESDYRKLRIVIFLYYVCVTQMFMPILIISLIQQVRWSRTRVLSFLSVYASIKNVMYSVEGEKSEASRFS